MNKVIGRQWGQNLGVPRAKASYRNAFLKNRVRTPSGDPVGHPFGEKKEKREKNIEKKIYIIEFVRI